MWIMFRTSAKSNVTTLHEEMNNVYGYIMDIIKMDHQRRFPILATWLINCDDICNTTWVV